MPTRRVGLRGAAAVELALMAPFLLLLIVGGVDMARMASDGVTVSAEGRAGLRQLIVSPVTQPGIDIRSEANPTVPNNSAATWGVANTAGVDSCDTGSTSCGDTGGCIVGVSPSPFWANGGTPTHCFSTRECTASGTPATCTAPGATPCAVAGCWGFRAPAAHGAYNTVEVVVVERFTPIAPDLTPFTVNGMITIQEPMYGGLLY